MNLRDLARTILLIEGGPISRVRFARTIYFTHKELIRQGLMKKTDIRYVRRPLGPAPDGFTELPTKSIEIRVKREPNSGHGLAYDADRYIMVWRPFKTIRTFRSLKSLDISKNNPTRICIAQILTTLRTRRTSELVEMSQQEPSWKNSPNGHRFYISDADMETNPLAAKPSQIKGLGEREALQISLIKGMIDDIVNESTSLEHPDEKSK